MLHVRGFGQTPAVCHERPTAFDRDGTPPRTSTNMTTWARPALPHPTEASLGVARRLTRTVLQASTGQYGSVTLSTAVGKNPTSLRSRAAAAVSQDRDGGAV